jgi:hypothetical protein
MVDVSDMERTYPKSHFKTKQKEYLGEILTKENLEAIVFIPLKQTLNGNVYYNHITVDTTNKKVLYFVYDHHPAVNSSGEQSIEFSQMKKELVKMIPTLGAFSFERVYEDVVPALHLPGFTFTSMYTLMHDVYHMYEKTEPRTPRFIEYYLQWISGLIEIHDAQGRNTREYYNIETSIDHNRLFKTASSSRNLVILPSSK